MVSANIPEQWLSNVNILRLSYRARDHHTMLLMWSVANRTDGAIPRDIDIFQPTITAEGLEELVKAGFLLDRGQDFLLTKYEESQSSSAQIESALENLRAGNRKRVAKHRAKKKAEELAQSERNVTDTLPAESKAKFFR